MAYETRSTKAKAATPLGLRQGYRVRKRGTRYNGSTQHTIDVWYDHWKIRELRDAIAGRTGIDPGEMDEICYVQQLVDLDIAWTFDFVGLPLELRNEVYGYLLFLRPSTAHEQRSMCYPEILRVNKLVNKEAKSVLMAVNEFKINIRSTAQLNSSMFANITRIEFVNLDVSVVTLEDHAINAINRSWPYWFNSARNLDITVELGVKDCQHSSLDFTQLSRTLQSLLFVASKLQHIKIRFKKWPDCIYDGAVRAAIHPLLASQGQALRTLQVKDLPHSITAPELVREEKRLDQYRRLKHVHRQAESLIRRVKEKKLPVHALTRLAGTVRTSGELLEAEERYLNEFYFTDCANCTEEIKSELSSEPVVSLK